MSGEVREQQLRFEIQHIFVREIGTQDSAEAQRARAFLDSIGFDLESRDCRNCWAL